MPTLAIAKTSNATFHPSYVPVAVFVGATSGVGQGMVEAFARHVSGRAHIIIVGRNEHSAADILASLPKPADGDAEAEGWKHEFVPCDVSLMANVRVACTDIRQRVTRLNFLVMTAGYSSMVNTAITSEGLDLHLAMRYYHRYVWIRELLPLVKAAASLSQDAKVMSVLGAGRGSPKQPIDLDNLGNTVKPREGRFFVAIRSMIASWGYTDAKLAYFASQNPNIAFTHINPGAVRTPGLRSFADFDGLLTPLSWILNFIVPLFAVSQVLSNPFSLLIISRHCRETAAEHMLYALFTGERGLYLRDRYGDAVSQLAFDAPVQLGENSETSVLNGVLLPGYGASDLGVRRIVEHSEAVTRGI
ncbi:hypothetical protein MVEN_02540600 [Mycena venus]|uniref:NAD(P)-binding protein n=1 Tax=Mycena venus TaxID=2733690 RepID=A0A8H6WSX1_9AGAR|nr:hypothetical protein MVEN_02540600 [Mycena venus]